jgi:phospholipid/cholesterol/gamma-HCH transport system ATP-binding protein
MVTHQDSTIRRTVDRVVFIYEGKVQWDGKIAEIDTTDNPLVRQFFSASTHGPIHVID